MKFRLSLGIFLEFSSLYVVFLGFAESFEKCSLLEVFDITSHPYFSIEERVTRYDLCVSLFFRFFLEVPCQEKAEIQSHNAAEACCHVPVGRTYPLMGSLGVELGTSVSETFSQFLRL